MQGAESILLEQGVLGAIIVLLIGAIVVLWLQCRKQSQEIQKDLCRRCNELTDIIEETVREELELARRMAEQSKEAHTAITLLTGYLQEQEERMREQGQGKSASS